MTADAVAPGQVARVLAETQRLAVLCTDEGGSPYASLIAFAFAPDVPSMVKLLRESPYGEAFRTSGGNEAPEVGEMTLEHNLYRILWMKASAIFRTGSAGVHAVLAYLTLRELEVKDLFTIIEDVRYHYDRKKAREFLIHPVAASFAGKEREVEPSWL